MLSGISLVSALSLGVGLTLVKDSVATGPFGHERMLQAAQVAETAEEDALTVGLSEPAEELATEDGLAGEVKLSVEDYPAAKDKLDAESK